jgi:hypothetical protein
MNAIENYWDLRRLPLFVNFYDLVPMAYSQSLSLDNETGTSTNPPLLPLLLGADGGNNSQCVDTQLPGGGSMDVDSLSVESESKSESDSESDSDSTNSNKSADKSIPTQGT